MSSAGGMGVMAMTTGMTGGTSSVGGTVSTGGTDGVQVSWKAVSWMPRNGPVALTLKVCGEFAVGVVVAAGEGDYSGSVFGCSGRAPTETIGS
ncbi:hypothetical protein [Streptomyces sp. x-45]|uniref:hypothetical protein n=1 Tax=Streptomyces sp. x-45 TaxID=2789281 RepID=UPI00397FA9A0